jgi:hypothetical protein
MDANDQAKNEEERMTGGTIPPESEPEAMIGSSLVDQIISNKSSGATPT